ncbi:hypothetical protein [Tolypothrix sp. NIES-4075]|uniref:hypothetical protein n=1 Tax=Tolypothrix sp. NIES-4075 TaxID=2005459 RepID=UPI001358CDB9|nr:hypothetical protein [Tolypothrix sp. NIES-4075]
MGNGEWGMVNGEWKNNYQLPFSQLPITNYLFPNAQCPIITFPSLLKLFFN